MGDGVIPFQIPPGAPRERAELVTSEGAKRFYYYRPDVGETIMDATAFESACTDVEEEELLAADAADHFYHENADARDERFWPCQFAILRADYTRVGVFSVELDFAPVFGATKEEEER